MREYKITEDSLSDYMAKNYRTKAVVGETADHFLIQRGNQVQQIRKVDVEAHGIREGIVDVGMEKHQSQNFGMTASRHTGNLKSEGKTLDQIQARYNNDPVYQSALNDMTPAQRQEYQKVMLNATDEQRIQYVENVRANYADKKYDDMKYQTSTQAELDRMEASANNPSLRPYGEGVKVHREATNQ